MIEDSFKEKKKEVVTATKEVKPAKPVIQSFVDAKNAQNINIWMAKYDLIKIK
jgi:hypothetical protein